MRTGHGWYYAIIEWFARNAVAANLLMAILLAGGLYSLTTIKKESQPPIETNLVSVTVPFLGASPEDVEEGVLIKVEEGVSGNIFLGVGYSESYGGYVWANYTERNLLGQADSLRVNALAGTRELNASVSYFNRHLRGSRTLNCTIHFTSITLRSPVSIKDSSE